MCHQEKKLQTLSPSCPSAELHGARSAASEVNLALDSQMPSFLSAEYLVLFSGNSSTAQTLCYRHTSHLGFLFVVGDLVIGCYWFLLH